MTSSLSRHFRILLLSLAALLSFVRGAAAGEPLKVVSWNMEWFPGHRPTASAEEAAKHMEVAQKALREINPDIFVGIEMHDWAAFHDLVSSVPGLTVHVVSSFRDPETGEIRPQQIGIASKLRCRAAWWEAWKANVPNIPRGYSFAALEMPGGKLLTVYGNHLKSNRSDSESAAKDVFVMREEQVRQLLAQAADAEKLFGAQNIAGTVAAGDFNTNHDGQFADGAVASMVVGGFTNTWSGIPREQRLTWRGDRFRRHEPTTFDYVFTRGFGEVRASIIEVPREISDHYPVLIGLPQ